MLNRYLAALQQGDWEALRDTVSPAVRRVGPFADVIEGREAYVAFLSGRAAASSAHAGTPTAA